MIVAEHHAGVQELELDQRYPHLAFAPGHRVQRPPGGRVPQRRAARLLLHPGDDADRAAVEQGAHPGGDRPVAHVDDGLQDAGGDVGHQPVGRRLVHRDVDVAGVHVEAPDRHPGAADEEPVGALLVEDRGDPGEAGLPVDRPDAVGLVEHLGPVPLPVAGGVFPTGDVGGVLPGERGAVPGEAHAPDEVVGVGAGHLGEGDEPAPVRDAGGDDHGVIPFRAGAPAHDAEAGGRVRLAGRAMRARISRLRSLCAGICSRARRGLPHRRDRTAASEQSPGPGVFPPLPPRAAPTGWAGRRFGVGPRHVQHPQPAPRCQCRGLRLAAHRAVDGHDAGWRGGCP